MRSSEGYVRVCFLGHKGTYEQVPAIVNSFLAWLLLKGPAIKLAVKSSKNQPSRWVTDADVASC